MQRARRHQAPTRRGRGCHPAALGIAPESVTEFFAAMAELHKKYAVSLKPKGGA